jgi:hypothetical protein
MLSSSAGLGGHFPNSLITGSIAAPRPNPNRQECADAQARARQGHTHRGPGSNGRSAIRLRGIEAVERRHSMPIAQGPSRRRFRPQDRPLPRTPFANRVSSVHPTYLPEQPLTATPEIAMAHRYSSPGSRHSVRCRVHGVEQRALRAYKSGSLKAAVKPSKSDANFANLI